MGVYRIILYFDSEVQQTPAKAASQKCVPEVSPWCEPDHQRRLQLARYPAIWAAHPPRAGRGSARRSSTLPAASDEVKPTSFKQPHLQPQLRDLAARPRESYPERCAPEIRGRSATPRGEQGMPGADAPAAARGVVVSTRVSHHGHTGITRAMVLTVSFVLSRVTGLVCHPRRRKLLFADLMPASGHQDHTTSPSAGSIARQARRRVHRIPPYVRDVAQRPLWGGTKSL